MKILDQIYTIFVQGVLFFSSPVKITSDFFFLKVSPILQQLISLNLLNCEFFSIPIQNDDQFTYKLAGLSPRKVKNKSQVNSFQPNDKNWDQKSQKHQQTKHKEWSLTLSEKECEMWLCLYELAELTLNCKK